MASSTNAAAKVYLITGGTGAGKTTYARSLADQIGGLRFSIDDWMTTLFWMDSPDPISHSWAMERIARCEAQIWTMAQEGLSRGLPVILDLGFTKAAHREAFRALAEKAGHIAALHWVDISADERWARVQRRNTEQGETFAMIVTPELFDFMEDEWEAPIDEDYNAISKTRIAPT